MTDDPTVLHELQEPAREMHKRFHRLVEPLRPDLYRYFLRLCGSPFDAEDFVQETLTRAFGRLHQFYQPLETRQYIFRMATNLWIDHCRRASKFGFEPLEMDLPDDPDLTDDTRAALERLVDLLQPRQRVALLLKDVFGFSIEEIATFLETTPGAVKALLHRGRSTLATTPEEEYAVRHDPEKRRLVSAYAERFSARNWDGMAELLRHDATVTIVGVDEEYGRDYIRGTSIADAALDVLPGHRTEVVSIDGEPIVIQMFRPDDGPDALRNALRFNIDGADITRIIDYWFCPDTIREIASRLGLRAEPYGSYTVGEG
jgi:RNA polymerase sigma-70 factor, ECF subfamily